MLWGLAVLGCVLGFVSRPPIEPEPGAEAQVLDLIHVACTASLVLVLLLGPGLVLRKLTRSDVALGFLPLPGLLLLIATGGLAWLLADSAGPQEVCASLLGVVLVTLFLGALRAGPEGLLKPGERWALVVVGCLLGLAVSRSLWWLGPDGELLGGTVSRTLEVGSRPDSRIPFHVVQLVAHGNAPFGEIGTAYFSPYNFSSRGPLAGLASAPIVLLGGGRPPLEMPEQWWSPYDGQGFMAFRLAMMAFSATALLSLWTLVRRLAGERAAQLAILLGAATPFLLHEVWFTWPKLLAASMVLLAAVCLIDNRFLAAGALVGFGYLMHPVALLSLPALLLLALWPLTGASWRHPRVIAALKLLAATAFFFLLWRLVNGSHYTQDGFFNYLTEAGPGIQAPPWSDPGAWLEHRLTSLGNTVVPGMLWLAHGDHPSINVFGGTSPGIVHFFFQYWNTLPFGVGILFFPLLLISLWRALRCWPWAVFVAVVVPFLTFLVYWGSYTTGMLPEGLQTWVLTLLAVVAIQQGRAGFPWLRSVPIRVVLTLRVAAVLAVAVVPTIATRSEVLGSQFRLASAVALAGILAFSALLAILTWRSAALVREPD